VVRMERYMYNQIGWCWVQSCCQRPIAATRWAVTGCATLGVKPLPRFDGGGSRGKRIAYLQHAVPALRSIITPWLRPGMTT
jgi:hypothetical protein